MKGELVETTLYEHSPAMFRNNPVGFVLCVLTAPLVVGLIVLLAWYLKVISTTLIVTDRRVSLRTGLLSRHTNDVFHNDIRNVRVDQSFFQRMMGTGDIGISSSGQSDIEIIVRGLPDPSEVKSIIDKYR